MFRRRSRLREVQQALREAPSYRDWLAAAEAWDALWGYDAWREEEESPHYDAGLLRAQQAQLRDLRGRGEFQKLAELLHETLYRNLSDLAAPALYRTALSGTKHLVVAYLDEAVAAMEWLAFSDSPGVSAAQRLQLFTDAAHSFGRSALLLSGGATLGFTHLGVVKALFAEGVLPRVISGASTGAMVAAGVCTRTDEELGSLLAEPEAMRLDGLLLTPPRRALDQHALLAPERLYAVLRHNIGDFTFAEAYARSGRALNISVSATRVRQKPRLLTHLTAPDVLVASAALASSALPLLFPPVVLEARKAGAVVAYLGTERWVDGSVQGDLPKRRLSRLHNANHFIVSQANPHALLFAPYREDPGLLGSLASLTAATVRNHSASAADLGRRVSGSSRLAILWERAHAMVSQDYFGDIDIHAAMPLPTYRKVFSNPTPKDLAWFVREGERAAWLRMAAIRDQTRISRTFERCIAELQRRA